MTKGWQGFEEVNRVQFDQEKVSLEQIEQWLKKSGTYVRTISGSLEKEKPGTDRE